MYIYQRRDNEQKVYIYLRRNNIVVFDVHNKSTGWQSYPNLSHDSCWSELYSRVDYLSYKYLLSHQDMD